MPNVQYEAPAKAAREYPQRMCIVSRKSQPIDLLLRLVVSHFEGETAVIIADPKHTKNGRGAWITPTLPIFAQAIQRKAIQRALRLSCPIDTGQVQEYLAKLSGKESHRPDHVRKFDP